jgi:HK97 gp10 family phage protein
MAMRGGREHLARLRRLSGAGFDREIGKALYAAGERIQVAAQISISAGSVSGKGHVPSSAPNPPNQDTGVLAGNIETVLKEPTLVEVSSNAPYSSPLEFGTSRMAARPFMAPARDEERPNVVRLIEQAIQRLGRRG